MQTAGAAASPRILVVDVLRAFALFGIIITHASDGFLEGPQPSASFMIFGPIDEWAREAVKLLTYGKFYTLFSFLFGLSFAIQMRNAAEKGRNFGGRFAWRLLVLLLIAIVHGAFFSGDVLIVYALLGLLLMLFRKRKTRTLVITGLILVLNLPGMILATVISQAAQNPEIMAQQQAGAADAAKNAQIAFDEKKSGDVAAMVKRNLTEGQANKLGFLIITGRLWVTFGLFLLGLAAGRLELFRDSAEHREFFRQLMRWSLPVALVTSIGVILMPFNFVPLNGKELGGFISSSLQHATLSAVYLAGVTLLFWRNPAGFLRLLAPTGKMGLTTYVAQSMFGLLVFYGIGFGLIGDIGVAPAIGISMVFFVVQVWVARWWLDHFAMGPLEWLWRALTYFTWKPSAR
jgi:uncharacterized protein